MHYEDQSRRFNLLSGLLVGVLIGSALALASGPLQQIPFRGRRRSRRDRLVDRWQAVRGGRDPGFAGALRAGLRRLGR